MLKRGIVKLDNYNNNWIKEYQDEEKLLKEVLKDYLLEIYHVGSTSIPGLKAKPIIDILVVINSLEDIPFVEEILNKYDYENRHRTEVPDRVFFAKGSVDARTHYLHITTKNSNTYYNLLYFKRYLLDHLNMKNEYVILKESLEKKYALDRASYTKGKDKFIKEVIDLAKKEYD